MNPRGCVCPRRILTMGSVSRWYGLLRWRSHVTAVLCVNHILLVVVIVVLEVKVKRAIGKFVFDNLRELHVEWEKWLIDFDMINFNLSLFFLHLSLARFNSPLRHCSPNLLEMTPSLNLSHPNLSDCLAPPVRRAKKSLNWDCRMRIQSKNCKYLYLSWVILEEMNELSHQRLRIVVCQKKKDRFVEIPIHAENILQRKTPCC